MNRRNALLGLAIGSTAVTGVAVAQGSSTGGGGIGTNLRALLFSGGAFVGTFDIKRFAAIAGQLTAIGTVTAINNTKTAVSTVAVPVTSITQTAAVAAAVTQQQQASCPILHLEIQPININLLGLVITTDAIVLDIVAVPGDGNLLGNLLCAIAGLLNPNGTLSGILNQLVGLLNQLLGAL